MGKMLLNWPDKLSLQTKLVQQTVFILAMDSKENLNLLDKIV